MNNWVKILICIILATIIYFIGFEQIGLYSQFFSFILIGVACIMVLIIDKINWSIFRKPPELLSLGEWRKKAFAALESNYPNDVLGEMFCEAEILYDVPIGILYIYGSNDPTRHNKQCVFGDIRKGSSNPILSPLEDLNWHLRTNNCKSKYEIGKLYLRGFNKQSLLKKNEMGVLANE